MPALEKPYALESEKALEPRMNAGARLKVLRRRFRVLRPRARLLLYILRNRQRPANEVFRGAWQMVDGAAHALSVRRNFRKIPVRHIQHYNLRQSIKVFFPDFTAELSADPKVIEVLREAPSVIATIHTRSELAICAALDRAGLRSAIITSSPIDPIDAGNYAFGTLPLNVLRDRNVFMEARAALRKVGIVVCDVDFVRDRGGAEEANYISASFFAFQQAVKARLYFGYTIIRQDGVMECVIVPSTGHATSPAAAALEFIDFIDRMQGKKSGLEIGTWQPPATGSAQ